MKRTWKPKVAGILCIVSGALGVVCSFFMVIGAVMWVATYPSEWAVVIYCCVAPFILGIIAIIGGYFALKRRIWRLALAGSIAALLPTLLLGIASIIFVSQSKGEFA